MIRGESAERAAARKRIEDRTRRSDGFGTVYQIPLERDIDAELARHAREQAPPTIEMGADLHRVVTQACAALATAGDIFQRDCRLVRVVRATEADERRGIVRGTPQIRAVSPATLREELTRLAQWVTVRHTAEGPQHRPTLPSSAVVQAVHDRGEWDGVRPLTGVIETPCMRADGSILDSAGYDDRTGLLYAPAIEFPPVPTDPTQDDAREAYARLLGLFADFPFVSDAARAVPISAILTMLARPAIRGAVPMHAFDACVRGAGKSLIKDAIAYIATGRGASKMTYPSDDAEMEKILASLAIAGARLVTLDNVVGPLGGAALDKVLTAEDRVQLRVLGRSEVPELTWQALVMAGGNNLVIVADTGRRTLASRLEPDVERPELRTGFRHADLLGYVREHRGLLVGDALTILRAYVVAGRPDAERHTLGSYVQWAQLVAGAIAYAGGPDILSTIAAAAETSMDPELDALRTVLGMLPTLAPEGATARTIATTLYPAERQRGEHAPDGYDALREAIETICPPRRAGEAPNPRELGKALRRHMGRVVGGRRLVQIDQRDKAKTLLWSVASAGNAGNAGNVSNPSRSPNMETGSSSDRYPRTPQSPQVGHA